MHVSGVGRENAQPMQPTFHPDKDAIAYLNLDSGDRNFVKLVLKPFV